MMSFYIHVHGMYVYMCMCIHVLSNLLAVVIYNKNAYSTHKCLLRVGGSILADVFLTSSFCVSNAASSSLLVAWYLN